MGLFDKAKRLLGLGGDVEDEGAGEGEPEERAERAPASKAAGDDRRVAVRGRGRAAPAGRPPLVEAPPPSQTIEDALVLRDAGDRAGARALLAQIDRGSGLRTVLRAAAALEEGDEAELAPLVDAVRAEIDGHRLLPACSPLRSPTPPSRRRSSHGEAAGRRAGLGACLDARSSDEATKRAGLVELLWSDAALARTVAARDLDVGGAVADPAAAQRYGQVERSGADSIQPLLRAVLVALLRGRGVRCGVSEPHQQHQQKRARLSLFAFDRPALKAFGARLKEPADRRRSRRARRRARPRGGARGAPREGPARRRLVPARGDRPRGAGVLRVAPPRREEARARARVDERRAVARGAPARVRADPRGQEGR